MPPIKQPPISKPKKPIFDNDDSIILETEPYSSPQKTPSIKKPSEATTHKSKPKEKISATRIHDPSLPIFTPPIIDNIVRERGFYTNSDSLISNKEIRLHDSFFYQAFSYVVETENDLKSYRDSIGLTHPAGMKFFALMTKEVEIDISALIETTFGTHQITFVDIQDIVENAINDFTKARFDQATPTDVRPILHVDKHLNEFIAPEESLKKATIKLLNDTPEITEEQVFEFTKKLVDSSSMSDNRWSLFTKTIKETAAASETINKSTTKPFSDSFSLATESSYSVALKDSYFDAVYFADKYFTPTFILEIS